jgi:energy-coupling factor transport system substrate-specific component
MRWGKIVFIIYVIGFFIFIALQIKAHPDWDLNWSLIALGLALLSIFGFFGYFEGKRPSAREIALLATLSAIAALGRVPFAAIPNVQPTTFLVIISGYVFGPGAGFAVGALAALTSGFFLGLGPWTPWQMVAWGLAGLTAGLCRHFRKNVSLVVLLTFAVLWGYLYGLIMNTWHWLTFIYPLTWQTFTATYAAAIWFDTLHGAGNGLFMWFMGRELISVMERFKNRLQVEYLKVDEIKGESI